MTDSDLDAQNEERLGIEPIASPPRGIVEYDSEIEAMEAIDGPVIQFAHLHTDRVGTCFVDMCAFARWVLEESSSPCPDALCPCCEAEILGYVWAKQAFHVVKSCVTFEIQNINTPDMFVQLRERRLREVMQPTD